MHRRCFIDQKRSVPFICRFYITNELDIKDTTESSSSAAYIEVSLNIDTGGKPTTQLYDKRDDFNSYQHPALTCIWSIYLSTDSICQSLLYIRSFIESGSTIATDRQVDVTGISTVSFNVSVSQVLWPL
jgi:hypothetical protein